MELDRVTCVEFTADRDMRTYTASLDARTGRWCVEGEDDDPTSLAAAEPARIAEGLTQDEALTLAHRLATEFVHCGKGTCLDMATRCAHLRSSDDGRIVACIPACPVHGGPPFRPLVEHLTWCDSGHGWPCPHVPR